MPIVIFLQQVRWEHAENVYRRKRKYSPIKTDAKGNSNQRADERQDGGQEATSAIVVVLPAIKCKRTSAAYAGLHLLD